MTTLTATALAATPLADLAAEPRSQEVTDWADRIGWVVGLLLFVALLYWLMRQGWKWRGTLQSDLPEPAAVPERGTEPDGRPDGPADGRADGQPPLTLTGRYHGSTTAGQWLDRIVAHGLGTRSRAELTLTDAGLDVVRPGARGFHVPAGDLRGARLDKGIAGKVLTENGLLVITWELGGRLLDSGFRADRAADHAAWVERVNELSGGPIDVAAIRHDKEGAA
ncbi:MULTISPECIES: hypothetical protein [Streptomyces]|uniref:PH-like domain-containing protein n=1 Tax=Streptomyces TaxID=1883 RepID=UPI0004D67D39